MEEPERADYVLNFPLEYLIFIRIQCNVQQPDILSELNAQINLRSVRIHDLRFQRDT